MKNLQVNEVQQVIAEKIAAFKKGTELQEIGTVLAVGDGVASVYGLEKVMVGELVQFQEGAKGVVLSLEEHYVGVALLGSKSQVKEGHEVKRLGTINAVPAGEALLGRVINGIGEPLDGGGEIVTEDRVTVEVKAPGIIERQSVHEPLQTGLKCVDSMVPIGRGQRELIVGDRQTGKTAIAIDTILNQKDTGVILCLCSYRSETLNGGSDCGSS